MSARAYNFLTHLNSRHVSNSDTSETSILLGESVELQAPHYHWPTSIAANEAIPPAPDATMDSCPVTLKTVTQASVYLTGGRHAVTTCAGDVVSQHRVSENTLAELPWQPHKKLSGRTLLLGNSAGASCYYHWMMDILPKLGYLIKAGIPLNSVDHFLVREIAHDFQIETLAHLGIDASRIVECNNHPYYTCDQLLVLNLNHRISFGMQRFVPNWIRETYLPPQSHSQQQQQQQQQPSPTNNTDRIKLYISRPEGVRRSIDNEPELKSFLIDNGFVVSTMEDLTVREQAALLARADVLIAAHGGALTNMVFAQPGTQIVELFGSHVYPYYYGLANLCQHDYHALLQTPAHCQQLVQLSEAIKMGTAKNQNVSQHANFVVDLDALASCLNRIVALAA